MDSKKDFDVKKEEDMTLSHMELQRLYDDFLGEKIKEGIQQFIEQDLENPDYEYITDCIWKTDSMLGGIGGYAMPANPVKNPFPAGIERELYRPLQYARSDIDLCDVRTFARYVIESSGMHLEAVCRLYLKWKLSLGSLRFHNTTLGKAVHKIEKLGEFESYIIQALYDFVTVYNRSKHEINQDPTRNRMFNAYDAVVSYFVVRVLGSIILQRLGVQESFNCFEINSD